MPEGALSSFLFCCFPQLLLLSQAWPVQSRAECLLFYTALPGSLLKGMLAFSTPGCLISTAAVAVTADKRQWAPELWCTLHLYLLRHSPASDKEGGGENGGQAAAFMCLYIDMSHQGERWTGSLQ